MARSDAPVRVTFVCLGNICRSPMAASVMRHLVRTAGLSDAIEVDSYGTGSWHVGDDADPRAVAALRRRGYPTAHRARQIDGRAMRPYHWILGLDAANVSDLRRMAATGEEGERIALLRSFDPEAPEGAEVPDPYYGGDAGFDEALDMIERACAGLLDHLRATALA